MIEIIIDFIDSYQLLRINRFIRKFRIDTIIDVEGYGVNVLLGSKKILKKYKWC